MSWWPVYWPSLCPRLRLPLTTCSRCAVAQFYWLFTELCASEKKRIYWCSVGQMCPLFGQANLSCLVFTDAGHLMLLVRFSFLLCSETAHICDIWLCGFTSVLLTYWDRRWFMSELSSICTLDVMVSLEWVHWQSRHSKGTSWHWVFIGFCGQVDIVLSQK